ncbi:MAG: signal peptide peptidase SppA [Saprospiraceae bacterium]|nr:signal peptide peptidase SppA [Saprospiraceae bacterium]
MRSFLQTFLASCLGVVASFALLFIILIGMAISGSTSKPSLSNNSILKLNLESAIPEKTDNVAKSFPFGGSEAESIGLRDILRLLEHAATDKKITGIVIENSSVAIGQASLYSLIQGIEKFKESGKFVYSYGDFHSQSSYMLCSVADSVFLNPQGSVDLRGFGSTIPFFKNMLDNVGIEMDIFYAGNFKSATEPFRLTEMSEPNKIQTREFLNEMHEIFSEIITKNRNIDATALDSILTTYGSRTAKKSLEVGLVDALWYKDQLEDFLKTKLNVKADKKLKYVSLGKYSNLTELKDKVKSKDKIAIVYAEGEIIYGSDESGIISEKKYISLLNKIRNDKTIKAVVLRVNSPGGNAFSSDVIWREIERIKESGKPVIASFGDYAASGGYYIAAGADSIVAQPNTLTGSIGVFMMMPNATKLLNDKIGITFDTIKTHPYAVGFSPILSLTENERTVLQEATLEIYDLFVERVATGRKLSIDSTKVIAQGRVWTGRKALELGLVDVLGGLEEAVRIAAEKAGIEKYKVVEYPFVEPDFFATIMKEIQRSKGDDMVKMLSTPEERKLFMQFQELKSIIRCKDPNARLPYIFEFN